MTPRRCLALPAILLISQAWAAPAFERSMAKVEAGIHGRVGIFAMQGGKKVGHRGSERFAYCSVFKWILGAAVLKQVDEGHLKLDQTVSFTEKGWVEPSPATRPHLKAGGMAVGDLCQGAITLSDNTATNLLEPLVGGPSGLQTFVRGFGDKVTRFDRMEPELNENTPGDPRDTSTPEEMAWLLRKVMEGDVLSKASRNQLMAWMSATRTGAGRIQAALPSGWLIAHKTGTSGHGATNDVAVLHPPAGDPVWICVFVDAPGCGEGQREAAICEAARLALKNLKEQPFLVQ